MLKRALTTFVLSLLLFFELPEATSSGYEMQKNPDNASQSGTLQKMIVESGSVTMAINVSPLNGNAFSTGKLETLHFVVAANSFFAIVVFNELLRGAEPGSMPLVSSAGVNAAGYSGVPVSLASSVKQLAIEKLPSEAAFDLAVRDA
jgi:hypothetical protein